MDAALGFRLRHPLHPVHAAFEFHAGISAAAGKRKRHFLYAAHFRHILIQKLALKAVALRIALIHAQKIGPKEGGLVAARAGPYFDDHVLVIVGILRQKHDLELLGEGFGLFMELVKLGVHHLTHLGI